MREYTFDLSTLHQALLEDELEVNFAEVRYNSIAEFVGLNPVRNLNDIGTFELRRARIPTRLFKSIVEDMDIMLM